MLLPRWAIYNRLVSFHSNGACSLVVCSTWISFTSRILDQMVWRASVGAFLKQKWKGFCTFEFSCLFHFRIYWVFCSIFSSETKLKFNSFAFQAIETNRDHKILLLFSLIFARSSFRSITFLSNVRLTFANSNLFVRKNTFPSEIHFR